MIAVATTDELIEVLRHAKAEGFRVHIVGEGTNTFFGENPKNILIIKNEIRGISLEEQGDIYQLTAGAGESWDDIVNLSVEKDLWGIENLSYIPGTVGAAPVQNIGAYGTELKDVFVKLVAIDMETFDIVEIDAERCNFGYRDSIFKKQKGKYCIISITIRLSSKAKPRLEYKPLDALSGKENITPKDVRDLVINTRQEKLPDWKKFPNAGSFFKNPVVSRVKAEDLRSTYPEIPLIQVEEGYKIPAAWLIEHIAEAKGVKMGDVGTWPTQPLVIVNYGKTTANELLDFSSRITQKIEEKTGISLEREVNYVC